MITEDKVTEVFCLADDFCKYFSSELKKDQLSDGKVHRNKPGHLSDAESSELYKRLKDFDMVYVYLANNSPENTWRNLIEEYNVKGENVFHYNLPAEQQAEIERALNINAFPSYRLVDKEGNLLDISVDPRMPGAIEGLLRKLSATPNK
ncbi:MAG: hypothetical protein K2J12_03050 [Muribaculaceae bacterium]|nr:hypothetical protein [Muribaculaceae bacterium]